MPIHFLQFHANSLWLTSKRNRMQLGQLHPETPSPSFHSSLFVLILFGSPLSATFAADPFRARLPGIARKYFVFSIQSSDPSLVSFRLCEISFPRLEPPVRRGCLSI
jgi:hypothetical protein